MASPGLLPPRSSLLSPNHYLLGTRHSLLPFPFSLEKKVCILIVEWNCRRTVLKFFLNGRF